MKKSIFVLGVAAFAVAMVSCNKDEIKKIDNPTFEGDKAYIVVNINDVPGPSTRATDGGFEYGTSDEYAVTSAHFYFYGSDGDFVTEASVWNGGTATPAPDTGEEYGNIEFEGYTVITLSGLTSQEYPNWVVTVLNPAEGFEAPAHIADFEGLLADPSTSGIMSGNYYTMATTSFVPGTDNTGYSSTYYFATPVTTSNFSLEPVVGSDGSYTDGNGDEVDPIVIYVERLAAKVTMGMTATANGDGLYPITVVEEVEGAAAEVELYVQIDGWALNCTAKSSNIVKTIDTNWTFTWGGGSEGWNDPTNYRSYWGESFNYGLGYGTDYPTSAGNSATPTDGTSYSSYLDYVSYNDCSNTTGTYEYCAENTNTAGDPSEGNYIITDKSSSAITNLLVAATVCDADGQPLDLVRCDGVLYTQADFLAYAANHIHLYTYSFVDDQDVYTQIDASYLTITNRVDGYVDVILSAIGEEATLYDDNQVAVATDDANEYIDEAFNGSYGLYANAYNGGAMYYTIPIEHLNPITADQEYPAEGNYGIVRNHIYSLNVTAIENIGWGVYDPDEIIIPQPEVDTYAITAQINILSWKLVTQDVVF